jgi:hypothetical protein
MAIAALILVFVFYPAGIILGDVARGQINCRAGHRLSPGRCPVGVIAVAAFLVAVGAQ